MHDLRQACVYLYRSASSNVIRYVGRGASPERAASHIGGTHNDELAAFIERGDYALEIAGPYESPEIAQLVEAGLISALGLHTEGAGLVNHVEGHGPRFVPFGVPSQYAERKLLPSIAVSELGRMTGGALIVRNSFGEDLEEGRPRLSAFGEQQDDIVVDNIVRHWMLELVADEWVSDPGSRPFVVVGAAGPPRHRYIPGSLAIDRDRLGLDPVREISVSNARDLDAMELRGRLLADARFRLFQRDHFIWVDGSGVVRHPSTD